MAIHPSAIIDAAAEIDPTAEVGAYAVIEGPVQVAAGARIYHHAYLSGWTQIGPDCQIHPFATIGHLPQDVKYKHERSYCRIGAGTVIREYASVHRATEPDTATVIGQNCFFLAYSHVGHNCTVGDAVTLTNGAQLAGHSTVERGAVFSVFAASHQFVRVGEYAMIGGNGMISMDVLPFMMMQGRDLYCGINRVGLTRNGFSKDEIAEAQLAFKTIYRTGLPFPKALAQLESTLQTKAGQRLLAFAQAPTKRGIGAGPKHLYGRHPASIEP
ncbi:MAG: acyl-ACP--UDP-N-acetylglucosamine O-acyltransferase [Phycisphaerae bacterium]